MIGLKGSGAGFGTEWRMELVFRIGEDAIGSTGLNRFTGVLMSCLTAGSRTCS